MALLVVAGSLPGVTRAFAIPAPQQPGSLSGTVFDSSGGVVRGAGITVTNSGGIALSAVTDDAGRYRLEALPPGEYEVKAALQGFRTAVARVVVGAGGSSVRDLRLEVAHVGETVKVEERLPAVTPDRLTEAQSVEVLPSTTLDRGEGLFLDKALNLLPGVFVEKRNALGGQRITIRGYGTSAYGGSANTVTAGFKAYLNGIPITSADGQTLLDDLDYSTIGRVEVVKGPASSLFGTGIGGVVRLSTSEPEAPGTRILQQALGGSDGLWRSNTRVDHATANSVVSANYGHMGYDGYRPHNNSSRDYATLTGSVKASPRQSVSFLASYAHVFDRSAGQLTRVEYLGRRNIASANHLAVDVNNTYDTHRFGLSHAYEFSPKVALQTSVFYSGFNEGSLYTQGYSSYANQNFGERAELSVHLGPPRLAVSGVVGNESQKTVSFYKNYGFTKDLRVGAMNTDNEISTIQHNIFTQWNVTLPARVTAIAGASANIVRYSIADGLAYPGNASHANQSGSRRFPTVVTARAAVSRPFGRHVSVFGNVSQGYTPPPTAMLVIPYLGTVNTDLGPERATLFEAGAKGTLLHDRLSYQVSAFLMGVTDKITPQSVTDAKGALLYTFYRNVGKQRNDGLEVSLAYSLGRPDGPAALRAFVTYSYSYFTYSEFKSDANNNAKTVDYSGLRVSGVPPHVVNAGADLSSRWGLYGNATLRYVDHMPVNYANTVFTNTYAVLDAKLGAKRALGRYTLDAHFGGSNLTDSTYYSMVYINSTNAGLFIPGPYTATFYGGVTLSCRF